MKLMRYGLLLGLVVALSGCAVFKRNGGGLFRGEVQRALPYKARLAPGEDKRDFSVSVKAEDAELADLRESVRYPATRYCLYGFGNTRIDWQMDEASGDWQAARDGENLTFSGRCIAR